MGSAVPSAQPAAAALPIRPVLIVDADADTRALYRQVFEHLGFAVREAADGRDALTKAFQPSPMLVITEANLPFVNGYALCEILRRDRHTSEVPIILVTSEGRDAQRERARRAGADVVLVKPTPIETVVSEMQRLMAVCQASGRLVPIPEETEMSFEESTKAVTAPPKARRRVLAKVHSRFMTKSPPATPPVLVCPSCDGALNYDYSYIGGVHARHAEQWDYYICPQSCGTYQYRHRPRNLRGAP
jgi:two-component system chemotaxis response regulator CheY